MTIERLSIDSDALLKMKEDFDELLVRTIKSMIEKRSTNAALSIKLNVNLLDTQVIDDEAPDGVRNIIKPELSHKVSSVMQIKSERQGKVEGDHELTWDEIRQEFVMKPVNKQMSLFD